MDNSITGVERRYDSRTPHSGFIFFATYGQFIEGELKNFCRHGLFIKTNANLKLGQFITVALPYMEDKQSKVKGQILWQNHEGYGVELVRRRSDRHFKLLKIEARSR